MILIANAKKINRLRLDKLNFWNIITDMRVWGTLHKNNKIIKSKTAVSENAESSCAFLECLEQIYHDLDLSEPLWISKHQRDIANFRHVKFFPDDFIDPVNFDWLEIEIIDE